MIAMSELEQKVSDIALKALAKDPTTGYRLTSEGRDALVAFLNSLRSDRDRKVVADEMLRVGHFIHSKMNCPSAALELLNAFADAVAAPRPAADADEQRKASARAFLGSTRREIPARQDVEPGATTAWWNLVNQ